MIDIYKYFRALVPEDIHYTPVGFVNDVIPVDKVPTREQNKQRLQQTKQWDLLVIGGGATGM